MRREALRDVGWRDPAREGEKIICSIVREVPFHLDGDWDSCWTLDGLPTSGLPPILATQSLNLTVSPCVFFLPSSRISEGTFNTLPSSCLRASKIPLSSNVSLTAASRYASPSAWRAGECTSGIGPSWKLERFPPGKTCAEGNEVDVRTLCRRSTLFVGERRSMLFNVRKLTIKRQLIDQTW